MIPGIVCVEGCDATGKSTLVQHLVERYGGRTMHGRVWKDMERWHAGILRRALRLVRQGELVVLDRHFISELIYGPIFRGGAGYSDGVAYEFDRAISDAPGVYVLCARRDLHRHLEHYVELSGRRPEEFADRISGVKTVAERYFDLLEGNMAHPGTNLVDEYIRYQDFCTVHEVVHHDMDRHSISKTGKTVLDALQRRSEELRSLDQSN